LNSKRVTLSNGLLI